MDFKPAIKYKQEEEEKFGFKPLNRIILGETSPNGIAYALITAPGKYNPEITIKHESTHKSLFAHTTVGNIQQLLAQSLCISHIDPILFREINRVLNKSINDIRWIHEGCATYYAIKWSEVYKLPYWNYVRNRLPEYYLDALKPYEKVIDILKIYEESKFTLASNVTCFTLSPPIYQLFSTPDDIFIIDQSIFKECLHRHNKILKFLTPKQNGIRFANEYNKFVEETYQIIHGFPWTTDVNYRLQHIKKENMALFAKKEVDWLFEYLSQKLPDLTIVNPNNIPDIVTVSQKWEKYFKQKGIETHGVLRFTVVTPVDIETSISVKPPTLPRSNLYKLDSVNQLEKYKKNSNFGIFLQIYLHSSKKPYIFNQLLFNWNELVLRKNNEELEKIIKFIRQSPYFDKLEVRTMDISKDNKIVILRFKENTTTISFAMMKDHVRFLINNEIITKLPTKMEMNGLNVYDYPYPFRMVKNKESYFRFSIAKVIKQNKYIYWSEKAFFSIKQFSNVESFIKSIDCSNLFISIWESSFHQLNEIFREKYKPVNKITLIINPTDLKSLINTIEKWTQDIDTYIGLQLPVTKAQILFFVSKKRNIQLIAPVSKIVATRFHEWMMNNKENKLKHWKYLETMSETTYINISLVVQGVSLHGFA